jgi:hypothetical protein
MERKAGKMPVQNQKIVAGLQRMREIFGWIAS